MTSALGLATLENAKELLEESKLLLSNRRFARSTALAILSYEEIGKYYLDKRGERLPQSQRHFAKQNHASARLTASAFYFSLQKWLKENGLELKHESELSETQKAWLNIKGESYMQKVEIDFLPLGADVIKGQMEKIKDFSNLRNKCFYVDHKFATGVINSPKDIDQDTAERAIEVVTYLLNDIAQSS
jgi:AbiV family abortive infection protein